MNIIKSAFTGGVVGWVYGGVPAFHQARRAFIERSQGELFQNQADAVVRHLVTPAPGDLTGGTARLAPRDALGIALPSRHGTVPCFLKERLGMLAKAKARRCWATWLASCRRWPTELATKYSHLEMESHLQCPDALRVLTACPSS